MSTILVMLFFLIWSFHPAWANTPRVYSATLNEQGQHIEIKIESHPFRLETHKVTPVSEGVLIDGRKPLGTDYSTEARTELTRFTVRWNGKPIVVPRDLYTDCYNASLRAADGPWDTSGAVYARMSGDGKAALVVLYGSEGAGAYVVWWVINKTGYILRFVDDRVP